MPESFALPVDDVRPSQCYLDAERLASVLEWFDFDRPDYDPLPVIRDDVGWYLTDGHTRAFAAHLAGADELRVVRDPDAEALPLGIYERCLEWCADEGVTAIADLAGRVVSREAFLEGWVRRCHALPEHPGDSTDVDDYT